MKYKGIFYAALLGLIFFLLHWWTRKGLPESYAQHLGYDQLYLNDSSLFIKKVTADYPNRMLEIEFGSSPAYLGNLVIWDSLQRPVTRRTNRFFFPEAEGMAHYRLAIRSAAEPIDSFDISYASAGAYSRYGRKAQGDFELLNCHLLIARSSFPPLRSWATPLSAYPKANSAKVSVQDFVRDSLHVAAQDPTLEKIKKTVAFILAAAQDHDGVPADSLDGLSPLDFLQAVRNNQTQLWCGNYIAVLEWLCAQQSILTRTVAMASPGISVGNHTVCEIFVPELRAWVLCDPTNRLVLIRSDKHYLNTIDLWRLTKMQSPGQGLMASVYANGVIQDMPLAQFNRPYARFYNPNSQVRFYFADYIKTRNDHSISQRLINLLAAKPNCALYSDGEVGSNFPLYCRMVSGYGFILFFVVTFFMVLALLIRPKVRSSGRAWR